MSLACNAKKRLQLLNRAFKPEFGIRKQQFEYNIPVKDGETSKEVFNLYEMADLDRLGKGNGKRVLFTLCQREFNFSPPIAQNQGLSLADTEAGVNLKGKSG